MSVIIRPMRQEDWPRVEAIYQAGMDSGKSTFDQKCPPWEAWDAGHLPFARLVAEASGIVWGWAALRPYSAREAYTGVAEVSVYLAREAQGQGIGTRLLMALIEASEAAGIWSLQSGVLRVNEASLRLHARCGFRTVGIRQRLAVDRSGQWRDVVLLERRSTVL